MRQSSNKWQIPEHKEMLFSEDLQHYVSMWTKLNKQSAIHIKNGKKIFSNVLLINSLTILQKYIKLDSQGRD